MSLLFSIFGRLVIAISLMTLSAAFCPGQESQPKPLRDYCLGERKFGVDIPTPEQVPGLLLEAVRGHDAQCVRTLLEKGASPNEPNGDPLRYALHLYYVGSPSAEIATILLDHGADLEYRDDAGRTPLMSAVHFYHVPLVRFLLGKGAVINVKVRNEDRDILEKEVPMLFAEIRHIDPTLLQLLIDAGADVNYSTNDGKTVLMYAPDDADIVEILLKGGANLNARDVYGHTVGCYSAMKNQKKKLAALRKFDPNFEIGCP